MRRTWAPRIGEPIAGWLTRRRRTVRAYLLPPYAPELNPVELIWGRSKSNPLANFTPSEFSDLVDHVHITTLAVSDDEPLLRSFIEHGCLPLRLR